LTKDIAYLEPLSRHRNIMPLYDLTPAILADAYVAPNATVIGEVLVGSESTIWYGAVLRGDLNAIRFILYSEAYVLESEATPASVITQSSTLLPHYQLESLLLSI
jgi:carbonic anhydrase/acetyltransferase-like protein (isoleucine patch superfamily)